MADIALEPRTARRPIARPPAWDRIKANRNWLGFWFMLPAMAFLILFLTYPLGLGVWLAFTDTTIGRAGQFIGLENFQCLLDDSIFWLSVFNTLFYTIVATVDQVRARPLAGAAAEQAHAVQGLLRAIVLLPWIVPTVLSALAFWWIYDPQFSIISWSARRAGLIDHNIDFLGSALGARSR